MRRLAAFTTLVLAACAAEKAAAPKASPRPASAPVAPTSPFDEEVLGWVVVRNLDSALAQLAGHLGAGDGGPAGIKEAIAVRLTGAPEVGRALDTSRPVAAVFLDPSTQSGAPPYLLRVPLSSRELFLESMGATFQRVAEPGQAERHVFQTQAGQRVFLVFEGPPGAESVLIAFRPGLAGPSLPLFARIAGQPASDVVLRVDLALMQERHERELASALVNLLVIAAPGAMMDPRSAHSTRLVRRALGYVAAASSLEARLDLEPEGVAIALRLEADPAQAANRLSAHIAEQEPSPIWGARLMPEDSMLVYTTHTTRASRQADARDLVKYVSGRADLAASDEEVAEDATGLAIDAFGDALQGDAIYAVWPGRHGGIGVGGALRVSDRAAARKRAMDAYDALVPRLGETTAMELGLDPTRFRFKARVKRGAARSAGQAVDVVELSPQWPAHSARHQKLFRWLFGDRLSMGITFVGDQAVYAAGRDWEPRLERMVRSARGEELASIQTVPAFARAVEMNRQGRVSLAYVSTQGMAEFVTDVVRATSRIEPEQQAMLDPFLHPGADGDAFVATTNVRREGGRAVYELHTHLPANAVAEMGRLGGAMWRVGLSPIFGPPSTPPLPTPPANVTPPPPEPETTTPPAPAP